MNCLTKLPNNIKICIGYNLFGFDLMNYLHLDTSMLKLSSLDKFWKLVLLENYKDININDKPEYLTFKDFYLRLYWESGHVRIDRIYYYGTINSIHPINSRYIAKANIVKREFFCLDIFDNLYFISINDNNTIKKDHILSNVYKMYVTLQHFVTISYTGQYKIYKTQNFELIKEYNNLKKFEFEYLDIKEEQGISNLYFNSNNINQLIDINVTNMKYLYPSDLYYIKDNNLYLIRITHKINYENKNVITDFDIPDGSHKNKYYYYINFDRLLIVNDSIKKFNILNDGNINIELFNSNKYLYSLNHEKNIKDIKITRRKINKVIHKEKAFSLIRYTEFARNDVYILKNNNIINF